MTANLEDYARKELIGQLARIEDASGRTALGIVIEGHLQAIAIYLIGIHGPQGAFDIFTRHTDKIIESVVQEKATREKR